MSVRAGKTYEALAAFTREYEAEIDVAWDRLSELGWPPGAFVLERRDLPNKSSPNAPAGATNQVALILRKGVETPVDLELFRVVIAIGGGALRYWCGWLVPLEHLPLPSKETLAKARLDESRWTRTTLKDGFVEDERPIPSGREGISYGSNGRMLHTWTDEAGNINLTKVRT